MATKCENEHVLQMYATTQACEGCDSGGCESTSKCKLPLGSALSCGNGAYQYNRHVQKCLSLNAGEVIDIDLSSYVKNGGTYSMDFGRRFILKNESVMNCCLDARVEVTTSDGSFSGSADPANGTFMQDAGANGWPANVITLTNTSATCQADVCYLLLGVKN